VGLGPTVDRLTLFIGPRNTFYVVVAWAEATGYVKNYGSLNLLTLTKHCFCHYTVYNIIIGLAYNK